MSNNTTVFHNTPTRMQVSGVSGFIGLLSCIGSLIMIYLILRTNKHQKIDTRFILYLSISDFIQGLSASLSFGWISMIPQNHDPLCTIQALLFEFGDVASAFSSAMIATLILLKINAFKILGLPSPGPKFEYFSLFLIFGVPLLFIFVGFMREVASHDPFWGPVSSKSWCWITENYKVDRMMLHYTWIFIIFIYLLLVYIYISYVLYKSLSKAPNQSHVQKRKALIYKMVGYPMIFALVFLPIGIERLVGLVNESTIIPEEYVAFSICMFVSNGLWNAIYYGYTRKIHVPPSSETPNSKKDYNKGDKIDK